MTKTNSLRARRTVAVAVVALIVVVMMATKPDAWQVPAAPAAGQPPTAELPSAERPLASDVLAQLEVKGRAPKTGYARAQFGNGWTSQQGCDTRNIILARDMVDETTNERCQVTRGTLHDPYTGLTIVFERGPETSQRVQVDHVVALSNAWQTGAQQLDEATRVALANDPLNLLAVDGQANQAKGDGDAATWLPPAKAFRCQYVARQVAVKHRYHLWVTAAERDAAARVLASCPSQLVPAA